MPDEENNEACTACEVCGKPSHECGPWIGLNRYLIGTGENRSIGEFKSDDEYVWDMGTEGVDDHCWTGVLLCWPVCASQWIEAEMIQVDFDCKGMGGA